MRAERRPIRHVIWDWNGTLLDDVACCVATLNELLAERGRDPISEIDYRERFGFPVRDFYEGLGFDFEREDFDALSTAFITRYRAQPQHVRLVSGALGVMDALQARGAEQLVVSAMERVLLTAMLGEHGVLPRLRTARGRDDLHAGSKVAIGVACADELDLERAHTVVIGDTLHDLEMAREIGCAAILFAGGHQARARLEASGAPVVQSLEELLDHVC